MSNRSYWDSSLRDIFDECGIETSESTMKEVVEAVENAADLQFEYSGEQFIPNPLTTELNEVKRALEIEKRLTTCKACSGYGEINCNDGIKISSSTCTECKGNGKVI